ncbi:hypothetical protein IAC76_04710 [Spirochaetes bacterium]|uniref:Uncharacterized protein n=1 Tax=Candidatus Scatousia excrementipullorum TaxID=2840936 RepID=A0A9D9DN82_9BACT|nr:hypothetical protein [Candidatus Scatousia excrementipullorum]
MNISAETYPANIPSESQSAPVQQMNYTPDPQIQQMTMMLNGGNNGYNDPMMNMLPYMMKNEGKNIDPQVMQAIMTNSMLNSINGMNNFNNNNNNY